MGKKIGAFGDVVEGLNFLATHHPQAFRQNVEHDQRIIDMLADGCRVAESEIVQLRAEVTRLHRCLNPDTWTDEHRAAWHGNIPDIEKAFKALRAVGSVAYRGESDGE